MFDLDINALLAQAAPFSGFDFVTWIVFLLYNLLFVGWWVVIYRRHGLLTFSFYNFAYTLWMPICFMLPFAYSEFNFVTIGHYFFQARPFLREAFLLGALGTVFFMLGLVLGGRLRLTLPGLEFVTRSLHRGWITSAGVIVAALISLSFVALFIALGFQAFNARSSAVLDRSYLPLYNFFAIYTQLATLMTLAHIYITRSRVSMLCLLVIGFGGLFSGARGPFLFFLFQFLVLLVIVTRYRRILPVVGGLVFFLAVAIYMGGWRHGEFGAAALLRLPFLIFYGNNFSDLRDFAWINSAWDGTLLWGKTFLAGFLTGLPAMPEFREIYSWGRWSVTTAFGFPEETHPGLRGIFFAEYYYNFGIAGLCFNGLLYGLIISRLSSFIENAIALGDKRAAIIAAVAAQVYLMFIGNFLATAAFFTVHVIASVLLVGYVVAVAVRKSSMRRWRLAPTV